MAVLNQRILKAAVTHEIGHNAVINFAADINLDWVTFDQIILAKVIVASSPFNCKVLHCSFDISKYVNATYKRTEL